MGEQGLAERLAAETARALTILGELGDRLQTQLADERLLAGKGCKLPPPSRDTMRVFREYRTGLEKLRLEAILRARLKINAGEEMPMTEDEYRDALEELRQEALRTVDRESLERELEHRPRVRLPPPGSVVIEAASSERPAPAYRPGPEHRGVPAPLVAPEEPAGAADFGASSEVERPATLPEAEPEPDDEECGWM